MTELEEKLYDYLDKEDAEKLLKYKKTYISLKLTKEKTTLLTSKVGGYGYLPKDLTYPVNDKQQPLSLLAQINFAEMPKLDLFPESGILAFFVDYFDDLSGADFDHPTEQKGFKVFYFPDTSADSYTEEQQKALFDTFKELEAYPVVQREEKLVGSLAESVPAGDIVEFTQAMGISCYDFINSKVKKDKEDAFYELNSLESGIGGYPGFTQYDPREGNEEWEKRYNVVLFQLDSEGDNVMWGDSGIGNFFINDQNLANKDFSDVLYNWDCF